MGRLEEAEGIIDAMRDFLRIEQAVMEARRESRFLGFRAKALDYIGEMIEQFDARGRLSASACESRMVWESWKVTRGTD